MKRPNTYILIFTAFVIAVVCAIGLLRSGNTPNLNLRQQLGKAHAQLDAELNADPDYYVVRGNAPTPGPNQVCVMVASSVAVAPRLKTITPYLPKFISSKYFPFLFRDVATTIHVYANNPTSEQMLRLKKKVHESVDGSDIPVEFIVQ